MTHEPIDSGEPHYFKAVKARVLEHLESLRNEVKVQPVIGHELPARILKFVSIAFGLVMMKILILEINSSVPERETFILNPEFLLLEV